MLPRPRLVRRALLPTLVVAFAGAPSAQTAKRPLGHHDYDAWRSIDTPTRRPDGRFLLYSFMPQDGEPEWMVKGISYLDRELDKERLRKPTSSQ
jgi:hypothetical protein